MREKVPHFRHKPLAEAERGEPHMVRPSLGVFDITLILIGKQNSLKVENLLHVAVGQGKLVAWDATWTWKTRKCPSKGCFATIDNFLFPGAIQVRLPHNFTVMSPKDTWRPKHVADDLMSKQEERIQGPGWSCGTFFFPRSCGSEVSTT